MKKFNTHAKAFAFVVSVLFGFVSPVALFAATAVNLGTAGNFEVLSKTGISTTGTTSIVGDIGVSPVAASYITGFGLILPTASPFSTSPIVTGKIYASDYTNPTPSNLTTAVSDMQTAFTSAMGIAPTATELGAGNIGGLTITPGVYKWSTSVLVPTDVTLSGGPNDVWIFQIAQNLTVSSGAKITLAGGAQASNIFWVVAGQTTIGTTALFNGNILDQTAIVLNTGAILNGRALAQTAVTLDSNSLILPTTVSVVVTPAPVSTPVLVVSCDPIPTGFTVTRVNNVCVYSQSPVPVVIQTPSQPGTMTPLSSANVTALQAQLSGLLGTVQSLQAQVQARQNASAYTAPSMANQSVKSIGENLGQGSSGSDVATLQQFLISQNRGSSAQALAHAGATGFFGTLTKAALGEFQASVGVGPTLGNFGPLTRSYISMHY